ncbi:hypothetical protein [Moorena producens]|nr:hypothetical protein [Moorena producens]
MQSLMRGTIAVRSWGKAPQVGTASPRPRCIAFAQIRPLKAKT